MPLVVAMIGKCIGNDQKELLVKNIKVKILETAVALSEGYLIPDESKVEVMVCRDINEDYGAREVEIVAVMLPRGRDVQVSYREALKEAVCASKLFPILTRIFSAYPEDWPVSSISRKE